MKNLKKLSLALSAAALITASFFNVACSDDDDPAPVPPAKTLSLTATPSTILNDGIEEAVFTVKLDNEDVTASAKVFDNDGTELTDKKFTSTTAGTYTFKATYEDYEATATVTVKEDDTPEPTGSEFYRSIAYTRLTGVNCGNCTPHYNLIEYLEENSQYGDRLVEMYIHGPYGGADPYTISNHSAWGTYFSQVLGEPFLGAPFGTFDFRKNIVLGTSGGSFDAMQGYYDTFVEDILANAPATTGFKVESKIEGLKLNVKITVKASEEDNYTLIAGLVEDGIVGTQIGVSGTFTHDNTLRAMLTPIQGDDLGTIAKDATVSKEYTANLNAAWVGNNVKLVLITTHTVEGKTVANNAAYATANGNTDYKYEEQK